MSEDEAVVLLSKINTRDKFPRWVTDEDLAFTAVEWAEDLADVSLVDAIAAMKAHYAQSSERMTIADVNERVPVRSSSWAGNVTEQRLAREARQAVTS